ncbi:FAD assembly factor SdhE [endosymbiont of Ridgeia piscesae]|jgi:antitoxin CptB|uniref:FAD assembly factor SdhE n=1 Tax=endosymbiont of Ridgeia piscesae TaxID=54398 RepID=A0A0T5Z1R3_9GAMM|nr:succinate dehydrogenase assembly factor 2 [endosymbiont of Ridgeia piscesae]KRT56593.1 Flavinator of succinate dehydrogenase [endosymbiont of Ridgeia piscesae]KRT58757.1 antitoxin CptB [endosymbiont of Ridgeia piscesae]
MDDSAEFNRLRWQCRRGMLELDLLLMGFLDQHYLQLDQAQLDGFDRLLRHPDQSLQAWLLQGGDGIPEALVSIINLLRQGSQQDAENY